MFGGPLPPPQGRSYRSNAYLDLIWNPTGLPGMQGHRSQTIEIAGAMYENHDIIRNMSSHPYAHVSNFSIRICVPVCSGQNFAEMPT